MAEKNMRVVTLNMSFGLSSRSRVALVLRLIVLFLFWTCSDFALAEQYKLVMNEEEDLCKRILSLYNDGAFKDVDNDVLQYIQDPSKFGLLEFSGIQWKELEGLNPDFEDKSGPITHAIVDIDNDGQVDWVVKVQTTLRSELSDQLAIYTKRDKPLETPGGFGVEDLRKANGVINFTGRQYFLMKLPKYKFEDGSGESHHFIAANVQLVPFRFRNVTYLLLASPGLLADFGKRKFAVATRYTPPSKLDDVCYIQKTTVKSKKR